MTLQISEFMSDDVNSMAVPQRRVLFIDVPPVMNGVISLRLIPDRDLSSIRLEIDENNDGIPETELMPTTTLNGEAEINDFSPPQLEISLDGTRDQRNFFTGPITISLTATDEGPAGLLKTVYSIDGGQTWREYHGETIHVIAEEARVFMAYSVDRAGNYEPMHTIWLHPLQQHLPLQIDQFQPNALSNLPGLIAYWSFDNCDARDESGNNLNGVIHGNLQCSSGQKNMAFYFDGDSYISIPFSSLFDFSPNGSFSIALWVKNKNSSPAWQALVVKCPSTDAWDYGLYISPWNKFMGGYHVHHLVYSTTQANDNWNFVVLTYNDGNWKLYVNSKLEDEVLNGSQITQSKGGLAFGRKGESLGHSDYFTGYLDEIMLFNKALTQQEVSNLFDMLNR